MPGHKIPDAAVHLTQNGVRIDLKAIKVRIVDARKRYLDAVDDVEASMMRQEPEQGGKVCALATRLRYAPDR